MLNVCVCVCVVYKLIQGRAAHTLRFCVLREMSQSGLIPVGGGVVHSATGCQTPPGSRSLSGQVKLYFFFTECMKASGEEAMYV